MSTQQPPVGAEDVLDFRPGADMRWEIMRAGPAFETVNWVGPKTGGPPLHVHPDAEESYEVLEGSFEVFADGEWRTLGPGEKVVVRRGVPHTVRNRGDGAAKVVNVHSPVLDFERFFRQFHRLVSAGTVTLPPKDPRSLIHMAMLFSAYPAEQRSVRPPQFILRALAFVGRRLGYRLPD